ncbi:hypothetical protein [Pseudosulfitobacter pseudonitzschiae]|nr:hypothetical protein [Pseudosulfitobacter pseudonitzschiae]MBM1872929.1 hypothetical protein [Pseudosulfitobacter pseudonitzschiae]MBM1882634.1 hypothetical protein [Pseudosulfitobacter pseudonitzschiae]MBM1887475.1 hypothetical protein [Pseudosulfitobacter pseudonitzschiae]MBM1892358.1 hypothetical protein [Pseudosulfitobacter pseudonitzschiae]MBM1911673.1 hypothetical protein [Pseudosulfitobacter pseudonitzschiae]
MEYSNVTDLVWADEAQTSLNCTVTFEGVGAVPFTATADDTEAHGREIFERAGNGDFGAIQAYVVPATTEAQIRAEGARRLRLIAAAYTAEERETWATQVDEANALAADPEADVPLISALAAADGVTVAQMAGFIMANKNAFTAASAAILAAQRTLIAMDPIPSDYTDNTHWT